jgi:hypothetical protein
MSAFEEQELKKLESALSGLTPRPVHLDRDGLLFEAGRRSVRPSWLWPGAALGMTAVASLLLVALVSRPDPTPERVIQIVHEPAPTQPERPVVPPVVGIGQETDEHPVHPSSYWWLQQIALRDGVEQLPTPEIDRGRKQSREPIPTVGSRSVLSTILLTGDN